MHIYIIIQNQIKTTDSFIMITKFYFRFQQQKHSTNSVELKTVKGDKIIWIGEYRYLKRTRSSLKETNGKSGNDTKMYIFLFLTVVIVIIST